jgi:molybdopterin synthase catalytic subunit
VYEAYESHVEASFRKIADEVRGRWPETGRIAILHRTGRIELGESSVVAAVSAPHRAEAFEAARYAIDALKASAPIWKHETWLDAESGTTRGWGTGSHDIVDPASVPSVRGA